MIGYLLPALGLAVYLIAIPYRYHPLFRLQVGRRQPHRLLALTSCASNSFRHSAMLRALQSAEGFLRREETTPMR